MTEAIVLGIPLIAAIVYLVVELFDLSIWWNKRRVPAPPTAGGIGDTWPEHRRAEAEDEWSEAFEHDRPAE